MLKRGVISNINGSAAEAFIPDEDNTVTAMLPFANSIDPTKVNVGDKCVIAFFDTDHVSFADGVIIAIYGGAGGNDTPDKELITFTINGTECHGENGMTWGEWINSEYNTVGCTLSSSTNNSGDYYVMSGSGAALYNPTIAGGGLQALSSDIIENGKAYFD